MKIRGKNLTVAQRKVLEQNGYDPDKYLYVKTEMINIGGGKHLNQTGPKIEKTVFIHRISGQSIRV